MKTIIQTLLSVVFPLIGYCQSITGVVSDQEKKPISGVTVFLKAAKIATVTDAKGRFIFHHANQNSLVRFTAVGYEPKEVMMHKNDSLLVVLNPTSSVLDEIQIIAYGKSSQRYNVGSVAKVKAEDIAAQPISNPLEALQGRVAGLVVNATSGLPGSSFKIQVRGQNTLSKTTVAGGSQHPIDNPLIVIDGIPFGPQNVNVNQFSSVLTEGSAINNNQFGGISPLNSLNPSDIESIEVLRDADATSIYGSRGGNGVILITTKKGTAGTTKLDVDARYGISYIGKTMPMMNTAQYLTMRSEAISNDGLTPNLKLFDDAFAPDLLVWDHQKYTDWKKFFLGDPAKNTAFSGALGGGNENTSFRFGIGLNRTTYIFPGDFADLKATFSSAIHHSAGHKRFSFDLVTNYSYGKNNTSGSPNALMAFQLDPNFPELLDENGSLKWNYGGIQYGFGIPDNPLSYLRTTYRIKSSLLNSNMVVSYKFMEDLTFRSSLGYNLFNGNEFSGNPFLSQNPMLSPEASSQFGNNTYATLIAEPQLEFKKELRGHYFEMLLGGSWQQTVREANQITGRGYINDKMLESINAAQNRYATDSYGAYKYVGTFGRLNYRYKNRYILNITARRDGSSRFGAGRRFGNFGAVGAGWLFAEEGGIKETLDFLSYGKLRASYGVTGSDATEDYQYISRWGTTNFSYDGVVGMRPMNLSNPLASWASTKKLELGLELGFDKDRFLLSSSYFRNRSGNQLISYFLPSQTGFTSVIENWNAVVENSGFEFTLQSKNLSKQDLSWNTSINLSIPKNKLLSFPGLETSSYSTNYAIGKSLNSVFVFDYAGVDPQTGVFQFRNSKGGLTSRPEVVTDGDSDNKIYIGTTDPKYFGGIQNTVTYKNFQLNLFIEFKNQIGRNYLHQIYGNLVGREANLPVSMLDRWQKQGDLAEFQRYSASTGSDAYRAGANIPYSSKAYSDASYIRLKTLSLSYNIEKKLTERLGLKNARLYASAQNIFTITSYLGNDPETQSFYGVPVLKTCVLGLQLTL